MHCMNYKDLKNNFMIHILDVGDNLEFPEKVLKSKSFSCFKFNNDCQKSESEQRTIVNGFAAYIYSFRKFSLDVYYSNFPNSGFGVVPVCNRA